MHTEALTALLAVFMRVADFTVRALDEAHDWVTDFLPYCQARGYLHAIKEGGAVSGAAIAGPISSARLLAARRPERLLPDSFEPDGDVLFGAFLFVDPARRGHGAGLERFQALLAEAQHVWPRCQRFAYVRRGRLVVHDLPTRAPELLPPEPEPEPAAAEQAAPAPDDQFDYDAVDDDAMFEEV